MSKIQIIALIIRLFAIFLFVSIIRNDVPRLFLLLNQPEAGSLYIAYPILFIILTTVAVLWFFPLSIAKKLLPNEDTSSKIYWENDSLLSIGFVLMGIFLIYKVISDLTYWFFIMLYSIGNGPQIELRATDKISIYVTIVELILSLFLIFGSRGISNLIMKFRGKL